ncbi:CPBP family intramembrane glutamic endopeptidase [Actinomadura madurae]|uniref:CPBP family intramembrane glutamic endopeptidase n=1 Tax=Actinomadura madurae TaxID=1993 RepID=UPI0020D23916|nr:CPBP family intramembrane glutamic endopeptidase [Actinomadura madurae]MCP9953946.1 CPBP family glutamic-type intramembrane protease [Actinomadura madurae]MCP9983159.1 CPBP family glutamic-type intramembrane protease [Actinomadura madurae]MCQ0005278.1 CPBP family glutamic-type intramembrane protease [Actinomadura madurae]MCQ0019412.1 CPBP family glutamic-type intramembrane protease [Actinomadura madurae]
MSRPGDADGWAPLDPELDREAQGNPQPAGPEPASQPPQAAWPQAAPQPYGQPYGPEQGQGHPAGSPYWQGAPAQPPGAYGTGEYRAAPYGQGQYGQGQYGPGQYGPGPYGGGYGMPPVKRPWTVETPEGVPFHRMARTEVHRWWRPLVGTVGIAAVGMALALGLMIIGIIVTVAVTGDTPEPSGNQSVFENDTADLAFNLGALAMFLPVALAAAWVVQRRRPGTLSSVAGRLRWRWLLACCGLAILFCAVSYGTSIIAATGLDDQSSGDEHWVGWGRFLGPAIVIILLVPFQAAAEEYAFRGWMLQAVGACTLETARGRAGRAFSTVFRTPWPGIVVGSALFTAGHGYTGWGILDIFAFGAIAAWLVVRTGGLEAGIALHVFNNLMAFLFPAAVGELDIEQGSVPWQVVVADIVPMVLFAAAVVWLARRMKVRTLTGGPDADDPPVTAATEPAHAS